MTKPRVLLMGEQLFDCRSGGLNRYLESLLAALQADGVPAAALVTGIGDLDRTIVGSGSNRGLIRRLLAFRRAVLLLDERPDVVDAHFALYALLPIFTTPLRRTPLVVHFQGPWADEGRVGRRDGRSVGAVKRYIEKAVYRRADAVVVLSDAFRRVVVDVYGVDESRVVVIPPGVDLDRFAAGSMRKARASLGISETTFVVVSVRRLDCRMGLDVLLEAWKEVQARHDDAALLIAGDGVERARLENLRTELPQPHRVRLLGRVAEDYLADLYRAADVSVVPTRSLEGFGLVTLESLACGTPAIVTDSGGLPDGVVGLDPSLVVPSEDASALARRLLGAAAGKVPSRSACVRYAERFSWSAAARANADVYERACRRRPLRVAYVGHSAALSGGELALVRMLSALNELEPVVVLAETGPLVERLTQMRIDVEVIPMDADARELRRNDVGVGQTPMSAVAETLRYTWRLRRRLRELRVDVVHTNTLKAALYGGVAGRLVRKPVVWHMRDRIAADYLPNSAILLIRMAARIIPQAVVANSRETLNSLRLERFGAPSICEVVASPVALMAERADDKGPDDPIVVGLVGRLAPWKGQELFLRAFAMAFPDVEKAQARIVGAAMFGEHAYAASLPRIASSLGIASSVDFVGFSEDVAREYARMDIVVHASIIPEPFGQVVVEAMAAGRPVVAANSGGPADVVSHGQTGLLYPMGDVNALAAQMRTLADDPTLRARLGGAGRERALDYTPERIASQVMKIYGRLIA